MQMAYLDKDAVGELDAIHKAAQDRECSVGGDRLASLGVLPLLQHFLWHALNCTLQVVHHIQEAHSEFLRRNAALITRLCIKEQLPQTDLKHISSKGRYGFVELQWRSVSSLQAYCLSSRQS